jgi:hypothetical protein
LLVELHPIHSRLHDHIIIALMGCNSAVHDAEVNRQALIRNQEICLQTGSSEDRVFTFRANFMLPPNLIITYLVLREVLMVYANN